jgi:hypothetical protein
MLLPTTGAEHALQRHFVSPWFGGVHDDVWFTRSHGVHGRSVVHVGPSPRVQSRQLPASLPPFELATQSFRTT